MVLAAGISLLQLQLRQKVGGASRPAQAGEVSSEVADICLNAGIVGEGFHAFQQCPITYIMCRQVEADFGLGNSAGIPTLVSGVRDGDLWDSVNYSGVGCAHPAMMNDEASARQNMVKRYPV